MKIKRTIIGVIGAGECGPELYELAEQVGTLIAENGFDLVCGGLSGVMEAAAKGAKQAGGLTIGILQGASKSDANQFIDIAIPTDLGQARNHVIALTGDAFIAVGGEYGTLSEIAYILKYGKPIVGLGSWSLIHPGTGAVPFKNYKDPVSAFNALIENNDLKENNVILENHVLPEKL